MAMALAGVHTNDRPTMAPPREDWEKSTSEQEAPVLIWVPGRWQSQRGSCGKDYCTGRGRHCLAEKLRKHAPKLSNPSL